MTNSLSAISFLRTIDLENENKPLKSIKKNHLSPIYRENPPTIKGY